MLFPYIVREGGGVCVVRLHQVPGLSIGDDNFPVPLVDVRDLNSSWGGKVKIVTGNGAAQGPGARDQEAKDRNRARRPIAKPKRILVLGCTSGAGQSVTALMTASILASLREHPVAAVDLHDGTLAGYRAPAAWLEELVAGQPPQFIQPTRADGLHPVNLGRLVLGDPGTRDAMMHSIQCNVPDATLLPAGIERLYLAEPTASRTRDRVVLNAVERSRDGDTYIYDLDVRDLGLYA